MSKNIKGITIEIDGNTQGLDKALNNVNKNTSKIQSELKQVDKLLKFDPNNTVLLAQKQELLGKSIAETSEKLKTLKSVEEQVEQQFKQGKIGEEQYRAFKRELQSTEGVLEGYKNKLGNLQAEQSRLADNTKTLEKYFSKTGKSVEDFRHVLGDKLTDAIKNGKASSADLDRALDKIGKSAIDSKVDLNEFKNAINEVDGANLSQLEGKFKSLDTTIEKSTSKLGKKLDFNNLQEGAQIVANVGQKIKEFGSNSVEAFNEVDAGMDIIILKTGATGEALEGMEKVASNIATNLPFTFEQVGNAVGEVNTQFGLVGQELQDTSVLFLKFADITETDVTASTINAKKAIEAYGLSTSDLGRVLDSVAYVAQGTGQSVDDIFKKAIEGAPQIKALGLTFEEGALLMGQFEQSGIDSSAALGSLSKASVIFAKDGKTLTEGLKETISSIQNASSETEALTIASKVFGTKGGPRMVDAIKRGKFSLDDLAGAMENVAGKTEETFSTKLDPIDEMTVALNNQKSVMAELGGAISESLAPILKDLSDVLKKVAEFFKSLPAPVRDFIVVLGLVTVAFAALAPAILAVALAVTTLEISLSPFLLIAAGIALVIAGIIVAWKNWGAICDWFSQKWEEFSTYISDIWNNIVVLATGIWEGLKLVIQSVWDGISNYINTVITLISTVISTYLNIISSIWSSIWTTISEVASNIWNAISTYISTIINNISGIISSVLGIISGVWSSIWGTISGVASSIWNGIFGIISGALNSISGTFSGIMNGISGTASSIWEGIKGTFSSAIDWIKGLFNFQFSWPHIPLPHFSISGSANPLDWLSQGVPSISVQWYAKGGILTKPTVFGMNGNSLMVGGEAGNEAVLPLNERTLGAIGRGIAETMGNNGNIVININNPVVREEADIQKIAEAVSRKLEVGKDRINKLRGI